MLEANKIPLKLHFLKAHILTPSTLFIISNILGK